MLVVTDFRCANNYTMVGKKSLGRIKTIRGLMLRNDDKRKKVRVIEIGACRGTNMHLEWGPLLHCL